MHLPGDENEAAGGLRTSQIMSETRGECTSLSISLPLYISWRLYVHARTRTHTRARIEYDHRIARVKTALDASSDWHILL
jgi:hypothetical protein